MNIILILDDNMGMMFNNRRQSRDRELIKQIIELTRDSRLYMNAYSYKLYGEYDKGNIFVSEDCLSLAKEGDYCLVESSPLAPYTDRINKIIAYRWNRNYPYDYTLDIDLAEWNLCESTDFAGNSHEKITKEVYTKW